MFYTYQSLEFGFPGREFLTGRIVGMGGGRKDPFKEPQRLSVMKR